MFSKENPSVERQWIIIRIVIIRQSKASIVSEAEKLNIGSKVNFKIKKHYWKTQQKSFEHINFKDQWATKQLLNSGQIGDCVSRRGIFTVKHSGKGILSIALSAMEIRTRVWV